MPVNRRLSNLVTSVQMSRVTIARPTPETLAGAAGPAAVVAGGAAAVVVLIDGAPAAVADGPVEGSDADRQSDP